MNDLEKNILKNIYNNLRERKCLLSGAAVFSYLKDEEQTAIKNLDRHKYITYNQMTYNAQPSNPYSTDVRVQTMVWITEAGQDKAIQLINEVQG